MANASATETKASVSTVVTNDSISAWWAGIFGAALTVIALAAFLVIAGFGPTNSLGFAALSGVGILSVSLIALIVLSRALGIATPSAALGLPPGSIRALLALGLAIVFVAVASWTLGGLSESLGPLVTQVTVPEAAKDSYIQRYPESDYVIGEIQTPPSAGATVGATSATVTLKIYLKRKIDSTVYDLAKQILTISATVLVTIIGFYFGTNSASDAARSVREAMAPGQDGSDLVEGAKGTPVAPADFQKTVDAISAMATTAKSKIQELGDDPIKPLRDAIAEAGANAEITAALAAAQDALTGLMAKANVADGDAQRGKEALASTKVGATAAQLSDAGYRLGQLLADATASNHEFAQKLQQFKDARMSILTKTAKG